MMTGLILGIDPGKRGALAFFDPRSLDLDVRDMPSFALKGSAGLDLSGLARLLDGKGATIKAAVIERVHAMPGQGVASTFAFGYSLGAVEAVVAAQFIPIMRVTPGAWKKALAVPAAKDGARKRASDLLPRHSSIWSRAKDDGRAEAALIALYGAGIIP